MTDILKFRGPRAVASRPAAAGGGELWAKNATAPGSNDGTVIDADVMNEIVAALRAIHTSLGQPASSDNDHALRMAIETYVSARITALINAAPGALDTLDELAAALGNDANFAATMTTALAGKQPLNANLTSIAALTTTTYGRSLLEASDAAALRALAALGSLATANSVTVSQISDASANGRSLISATDYAAMMVLLPVFGSSVKGLVPPPTTPSGKFLKDNGTWDTPAAGASQWLTSGANIYFNTGNVGIGETSPSEALHVVGRILVDGSGYVTDPSGVVVGRYSSTIGYIQAPTGSSLQIWAPGTIAIATFLPTGNVGIGTTSPGQKLTVAGTIESTAGGIKFPDSTTQATAAQENTRLGTEASITTGATNTNYKAPAGNILTGIQTHLDAYSSGNGAQVACIYYKPLQKYVSGSWTTVTG